MSRELGGGMHVDITALAEGMTRLRAYGHDGPVESLLERYGFLAWPTGAGKPGAAIDDDGKLSFTAGKVTVAALAGTRLATAPTLHGNRGCVLELPIEEGEKWIGGGDHYRQGFLLNGRADDLWIRYPVKHVPVPLFLSSRGYGIFFNTTRRLRYDVGAARPGVARFTIPRDYLDLTIIPGRDYADIIRKYTLLTGRPSLPPLKSFGLWLILHTMADGHDVLNIAKTLRTDGIPCDNLSLEPDWMQDRYDYSLDKEWNNWFRGAPNSTYRAGPNRMIHALNRMGYDLGLWLCTRYDFTWEEERRCQADRPAEEDTLDLDGIEVSHQDDNVGHSPIRMDTVTRPDEPWFEHLKRFVDDGVRYFKVDPALLINEFPDRLYGNGRADEEMHNIAFMLCSKQMCLDYEAHTGRRYYGISVAGWAGLQRYPGTWAGDTGGGAQSLVGILQDALIGHAFATCDMNTAGPEGIHLGFLLPWALINSWASYHYPGYQGDFIDGVYREYSRLRMSLLPYLYGLAREATRSGLAMARPMCLAYPDADKAYELTNQFLLGDRLLVTSYTNEVTLPEGRWYDWWEGELHTGAWQTQTWEPPAAKGGCLLVGEGAIIPMVEPRPHASTADWEEITWRIFPGTEPSSFTLYIDDGDSLGYRDGRYAEVTLTMTPTADGITLTWSPVSGDEPERIDRLRHRFEVLGSCKWVDTVRTGTQVTLTL